MNTLHTICTVLSSPWIDLGAPVTRTFHILGSGRHIVQVPLVCLRDLLHAELVECHGVVLQVKLAKVCELGRPAHERRRLVVQNNTYVVLGLQTNIIVVLPSCPKEVDTYTYIRVKVNLKAYVPSQQTIVTNLRDSEFYRLMNLRCGEYIYPLRTKKKFKNRRHLRHLKRDRKCRMGEGLTSRGCSPQAYVMYLVAHRVIFCLCSLLQFFLFLRRFSCWKNGFS